jgi:hypothetical protein
MKIKVPSKKIRERFLIIYEIQGCQKAVNYLTRYYGIRKMKIIVDGRRVMRTKTHKTYLAHYYQNKAYFTKRGLTRRLVLHELCHHIVDAYGLDMGLSEEERGANRFAREFQGKAQV